MLNISQSERKPRKKGQEPGIQGTGDGRFGPSTPPPSPVYKPKVAWGMFQVPLYNLKTLLPGSATKRNNPAMQYKIYTSATITDRIQLSFNLRQTRLKIFPPPPPLRRIGKWRVLAFARLHPWGGVGFVVPFYSVQDCCQHYLEVGLWGEKYVPVIKWALARSKNRMIKIGCFDFRLYGVCSSQTMNSLTTITFAWALRENVC